MTGRSLHIALLVSSTNVPEWQYQMIQRLLLLRRVHLKMVIVASSNQKEQKPISGLALNFSLNCLKFIDRCGFKSADPLQPRSLNSLCSAELIHDITAVRLEAIYGAYAIDLLLNPEHHTELPEYFFRQARFGVWRIFAGTIGEPYQQWTGVREHVAASGQIYSGITVAESSDTADGCVFLSSNSTNAVFLHRSVEPLLWKMAAVLPQLVQQLRDSDHPEQMVVAKTGQYAEKFGKLVRLQNKERAPGWSTLTGLLRRSVVGKGSALITKLLAKEQWVLLYGKGKKLEELKPLQSSIDKFWADPQLVSYQNRHFIFLEEWVEQNDRGRIVCIEWLDEDKFSDPVPVLEEPYHLSYPHVFCFENTWYMIPESAENKTITLYRCTRFPDRWEVVHELMRNIAAYDVTLHEYLGRWWMFVNVRVHEHSSSDDLLYLYSADSPLSQNWLSHPANPVVSDVSSARSAGKIIRFGNKYYRPSQNCAGSYGRGLNLNQILVWNEREYQECTLSKYVPEPESELHGMHTFSVSGDRIVSDGLIKNKIWKR